MKYIIDMPEGWEPRECGIKCSFATDDFTCVEHKNNCPLANAKKAVEAKRLSDVMGKINMNGHKTYIVEDK